MDNISLVETDDIDEKIQKIMIIDCNKVELFYIVNCHFILININSLPAY